MTLRRRLMVALPLAILFVAIFLRPLLALWSASRSDNTLSHAPLIPAIAIALLLAGRRRIFGPDTPSPVAGSALLAVSIALLALGPWSGGPLSLGILALVIYSLAAFVLVWGRETALRSLFPLLFLSFMIPLPGFLLDRIVAFLQHGSAQASSLLFHWAGIPFVRETPLLFHLPGLNILVAEECSGIRSSIALLITGTLAAHLYLSTWWGRSILMASILPLAILKNALRIVTLSLLAMRVDPSFIGANPLHQRGGGLFFAFSLLLLGGILLLLRRAEGRGNPPAVLPPEAGAAGRPREGGET